MADGDIGRGIRARRKALALTLEDLARRSGVSSAMLSEVERGLKNPTVKLAYQIARALDCSLTDLIEEPTRPVSIVRAEGRRTLVDPDNGVTRHGLSREGVELAWYELPAQSSVGEMPPNRPGLVEHLTVLVGELVVVLGGARHCLGPRDTLTYGPQTTTEYRNESDGPLEFLLLCDSSRIR